MVCQIQRWTCETKLRASQEVYCGCKLYLQVIVRCIASEHCCLGEIGLMLLCFCSFPGAFTRTSEVSAKIEYIKVRLERFQDLLNNTNTAQNRDFQDLRKGGCVV